MSDPAKTHRVLVKVSEGHEAAAKIEHFEYVECTAAQAYAYANGDANWRAAKAAWYAKLWHRLTGDA